MNAEEVKQLLDAGLPDCEIQVTGGNGHFDIVAVGDQFSGLNTLRRQQTVYAALGDAISSGRIHAVKIRALHAGENDAGL